MSWTWRLLRLGSLFPRTLRAWRQRHSRSGSGCLRKRSSQPLTVELLEQRNLLTWSAIGPAPQLDPDSLTSADGQDVTGRVSALGLVDDEFDGDRLLLGAAGGGIWYA